MKRGAGVLWLALLLLSLMAAPVAAVEATEGAVEQEPAPSIDQIGTRNEVSLEYFPERQEPASFFRFFNYPLLIAAVAIPALLLAAYLVWQPRFAEERRSKRRR